MESSTGKPSLLSNVLVRVFSFGVLVFLARFAYIVTIRGKSCDSGDFCFFSSIPDTLRLSTGFLLTDPSAMPDGDARTFDVDFRLRNYFSSVFQDMITEGYLSPDSKVLCIETINGQDVVALREIGVPDSIGISKKPWPPFVVSGQPFRQPFGDNTFDFEYSGNAGLDRSALPAQFASEVLRTLKPGGFFVVHTAAKDLYSLNSLLDLFNSCRLIRSRDIDGFDSSMPSIREIVLKNENEILGHDKNKQSSHGNLVNKCSVPEHKRELIRNAEPLIPEEPLKPWITLKKNIKNIRYLSSMVDISFKRRYVYIDVGARSYGSSIGSWFRKQYPKQNKTFEIYAIEADKAFHEEYRTKKRITLLPYAAWVRNETLFFGINREPSHKIGEKGRGMGRIQAVQSSSNFVGDLDMIQGIDFANWLKNTVSERDFVMMKMDVEGTEFHLIPRLFSPCITDGPPLGAALVERLDWIVSTLLMPLFFTTCRLQMDVFAIQKLKNNAILRCFSLAVIRNSKSIVELAFLTDWKQSRVINDECFAILRILVVAVAGVISLCEIAV
ncbi:hypothetical protein F0562_021561 [Nyssa sinensis]|uniref:DUF7870 domain-containing protein n=1 Tax=Nyssa sinensis TaxID=561372 RepID=A0A5J5BKT8_9ASTE|nr:hypothetical protein F0562_021561 [Nyssa sinensis]